MKKFLPFLFTILSLSSFAAGHVATVGSQMNVSCFGGADASATINVSGGSGNYMYSWSPAGGSGNTATGLTAGSYTVIVTDNSDMSTASVTVTILQPAPLMVNTASNPASCNGTCDGQVSAMVSGGNPPYTYQWVPMGAPMPAVTGLCPGTYTVAITDSNGCMATGTATVTPTGGASLTGVTVTDSIYNETCLASGDGAIDITLSGSNPGPFTYQWNNGQTTQDATGLESNLYTVVIFDASMNCLSQSYQVQAIGTNCGGIEGKVYVDFNSDCAMNGSDLGLSNIRITTTPGNYYAFTNASGEYSFNNLPYGSYTLTQQINNLYISENYYCPGPINATINGGMPFLTNQNFSDTANYTAGPDLSVTGFMNALRPGFPSSISLVLNNHTVISASGVIKSSLPPGYGAYISSANPAGYTVTGDTISWNFSGLIYGSASFNAYFTVPVNEMLGTVHTSCAIVNVTGDIDLSNNTNCFSRTVMGSFDPNDKSVDPQGVGAQGGITLADDELTYMIRFQNTGNAEAINITVLDTLSDKVDLSTLEMVAASHTYNLDVLSTNVLRWKFDNIMLVDSNTNEPASHGWILYKVKQSATNVIGDEIRNTAYIYFDFNSAVVTNTTLNTIQAPLNVEEIKSDGNVSVYPNPFSESTSFVIKNNLLNSTYHFEMTDVLGKQVRMMETSDKQFTVSREGLRNGMYFYSITNNDGVVGKGKIIIK
ncbi:MAG: hypothetical protein K0Q95_3223 [Bacteroidota bacterium]|jgi:uncharacterized repeat protein (TIGR01451 family)|nr:hypothetical protein [Bacteroidota bacterium]